jgi:hypothetical protein
VYSHQIDNVKVVSRDAEDLAKVNAEPAAKAIAVMDDGGLSDNDEINGEERLAAVHSPPKGKKRVTSEVSPVWVSVESSSLTCYPATYSRKARAIKKASI